MLISLDVCPYRGELEDVYFSNCYVNRKPSFEESKNFAVETQYNPRSFGVHACWKHLKKDELVSLTAACKGLEHLAILNTEYSANLTMKFSDLLERNKSSLLLIKGEFLIKR
jgi:hypothetical protein